MQVLLPLIVLGGGAFLAWRIGNSPKQPTVTDPPAVAPLVRTALAERTEVQLDVETSGTVEPYRTIVVGAEVAARVVATHPQLRAGGQVAAGDVLVELDPRDFDVAIVQQEAAVARAELRLLQERAEAEAAVRAWRELEGERPADALVTRAPQIADADKALAAARAALEQARLDRARTHVTAPVAGRVQSAAVEVGQFVQPGQQLALLFDLAAVEVRLPIPTRSAAFVDLPLAGTAATGAGAAVTLRADFAGARHEWTGHVVRTEGELDRRTRQLTVVARVDDPFTATATRPPLLVGTFVEARIAGRTFADVVVVPRAALRAGDEVWVVDAEQRLRRRAVTVLRTERDRVVLQDGIEAGTRVCTSALETATDGMAVRLVDATEPASRAMGAPK
ncbi:MAG: efflux RND transporter periplasmic adaptor subunit [Planctomycetes bacterium]|nr:efflux RND transporter periplasmic adaptor subunit [Planctomycetota bacterium]